MLDFFLCDTILEKETRNWTQRDGGPWVRDGHIGGREREGERGRQQTMYVGPKGTLQTPKYRPAQKLLAYVILTGTLNREYSVPWAEPEPGRTRLDRGVCRTNARLIAPELVQEGLRLELMGRGKHKKKHGTVHGLHIR